VEKSEQDWMRVKEIGRECKNIEEIGGQWKIMEENGRD
jgi:hypothetical protein